MSGTLYLCATPIGNLEDITLRVLNMLKSCDLIAAEDTRHTLKILNHFDIQKPMTSYHEHNKLLKGPKLLEKLLSGLNIALVTDAGMPGISDPGVDMVRLCHENNVPVTVLPGACASVTALVLSGLENRRFIFEGFLPSDKKEKAYVLKSLENETRTVIFYEAPHRLLSTLEELYNTVGDRNCACIREITKKHEEVRLGKLGEIFSYFKDIGPKGEFVIILEGKNIADVRDEEINKWVSMPIEEHMKIYAEFGEKEAMKKVAKDRGVSKREIYKYLVEFNENV